MNPYHLDKGVDELSDLIEYCTDLGLNVRISTNDIMATTALTLNYKSIGIYPDINCKLIYRGHGFIIQSKVLHPEQIENVIDLFKWEVESASCLNGDLIGDHNQSGYGFVDVVNSNRNSFNQKGTYIKTKKLIWSIESGWTNSIML